MSCFTHGPSSVGKLMMFPFKCCCMGNRLKCLAQPVSGAQQSDIPSPQTSYPRGVMWMCVAYVYVFMRVVHVHVHYKNKLTQIPPCSVLAQTELNLPEWLALLLILYINSYVCVCRKCRLLDRPTDIESCQRTVWVSIDERKRSSLRLSNSPPRNYQARIFAS